MAQATEDPKDNLHSTKKISYEDEKERSTHDLYYCNRNVTISKMFNTRGFYSLSGPLQNITLSKINFFSNALSMQAIVETEPRKKKIHSDAMKSLDNFAVSDVGTCSQTGFGKTQNTFTIILPPNLVTLMNESKLWGCYYILPQLYEDEASPTVTIKTPDELDLKEDGILTKDLIATCLSYLSRSPISGDYVYIKLDLSSRKLQDISEIQYFKFIQYLDLSRNMLTNIHVLSHLPYLQYLTVSFNSLSRVLDYETPQWFLTEVNYKYNDVKKLDDLSQFWSITVLDLSHNNITMITGLKNLAYLRKLDLSFNHIRRLENLNHLRLTWLDISYNNISSFEFGSNVGLKTLVHLEYLNMNDNQISTSKIFFGVTRLRELHCRNNILGNLLEFAVYMKNLQNLHALDLRGNTICSMKNYRFVVLNTVINLLRLDDKDIDPAEQITLRNEKNPDVLTFATERLLHLLYVEQLSKATVSPHLPPADTTEVPIVVLVGVEAIGKGSLCRRLAKECSEKVRHARLHTTATHHPADYFIVVKSDKMDDMVVKGELLTYGEINGDSYGLSRSEAFVNDNRVVVAHMDQSQALMLRLRYRRPYLLLLTGSDQKEILRRQEERKKFREEHLADKNKPIGWRKRSTLQVLVSRHIDVTGILNELLMRLPEGKMNDIMTFDIPSSCSLSVGNSEKQSLEPSVSDLMRVSNLEPVESTEMIASNLKIDDPNIVLESSSKSKTVENHMESIVNIQNEASSDLNLIKKSEIAIDNTRGNPSMHSLFKQYSDKTNSTREPRNASDDDYHFSITSKNKGKERHSKTSGSDAQKKDPSLNSRMKSVDTSRMESNTSSKAPTALDSAKSVTFQSQEDRLTGVLLNQSESQQEGFNADNLLPKSISTKFSRWLEEKQVTSVESTALQSTDDLWHCNILNDMRTSDEQQLSSLGLLRADSRHRFSYVRSSEDAEFNPIFKEMGSSVRDDYESFNRKCPGVYWYILSMDNHEEAYNKLKTVIKDIVRSQKDLQPMFDIDFRKSPNPIIRNRVKRIMNEISTNRMFH